MKFKDFLFFLFAAISLWKSDGEVFLSMFTILCSIFWVIIRIGEIVEELTKKQ